jgi:hypothetical protein
MHNFINNLKKRFQQIPDRGKYIMNRNIFSDLLFIYGTSIVAFLFFIDLVSAVSFLFHGTISAGAFYISLFMTVLYLLKCCRHFLNRHTLQFTIIIAQLIIITFLSAFIISGKFYDLSYDGQAYHQEAIIRMKEGWNPVYKQYTSEEVPKVNVWINDYPKAAWVYESVFYKMTDHIEYAKAGNFVLIAAAFAVLFSLLLWLRYNIFLAGLVSFFVACNPVSIYQTLTFYIDGQLASLFNIVLALMVLCFFRKNNNILLPLIFSSVMLANMKFTGFIYVGILFIVLICVLFINYKDKAAVKMIGVGSATILLAAAVIGFNPYVTNTFTMHNPFYPAAGQNALDLVTPNIPQNYQQLNGAERFFISAFAKSDNTKGEDTYAQSKIPFTVSLDELKAFTLTYATQGSYGPFYSGLLILSFLILLSNTVIKIIKSIVLLPANIFGYKHHSDTKHSFKLPGTSLATGILILLLLSTILIVPVSSVARYVPQGFLIPVIVILYAFKTNSTWKKALSVTMLYILFLNTMLITIVYYRYNKQDTEIVHQQLMQLKTATANKPVTVYFDEFRSTRIRLAEAGIHFNEVKSYQECGGRYSLINDNISLLCSTQIHLLSDSK